MRLLSRNSLVFVTVMLHWTSYFDFSNKLNRWWYKIGRASINYLLVTIALVHVGNGMAAVYGKCWFRLTEFDLFFVGAFGYVIRNNRQSWQEKSEWYRNVGIQSRRLARHMWLSLVMVIHMLEYLTKSDMTIGSMEMARHVDEYWSMASDPIESSQPSQANVHPLKSEPSFVPMP